MLVVVLGLLVALFVIGTSFSFITLSERKAAQNYLDRQRALDLALDGVEYSIARLRAEAVRNHYEGIGPGTAGLDQSGLDFDPDLYTNHPLDARDPAVSWPRSRSITSNSTSPDGMWIDFNGDNIRGGNETANGNDIGATSLPGTITGFHGDGINVNHVRNDNVARVGDGNYGPSGTYMELGDYFRVRAVDAASLLNLNNYKDDRLESVLLVLGEAIDAWLNRGRPSGKHNPFPPVVVQEFMIYAEQTAFIFTSKEQLRPIWNVVDDSDRLYDMAMNFITLNSWVDRNYRDYAENNSEVDDDKSFNPKGLTNQQMYRGGYSNGDQDGRDGWPDWQPKPSSYGKAPVNINTAPFPVLVCLFANLEAKARLLFFQKQGDITENETLIKSKFNQDVPIQNSGTTDLGRQNNRNDLAGTGIVGEDNWYPNGEVNQAIFQMVPIGPITTTLGKSGNTSSQQGGEDYASALALEVLRLRSVHPFTSWQDFDARFCRGSLLGINDVNRNNVTVPDVVGAIRGDLQRNPTLVDGAYPKQLLPDPGNCNHAANPIKSGDSAMTGSDFRAWYWKCCVDMVRSALCPSNLNSRYNVDYPLHMNVDRMDLTVTSSPICFSSMGVYEVVSQGEILSPKNEGDLQNTSSTASGTWNLMARRKVRTVVQIYEVLRHGSQLDFNTPLDPAVINPQATTSSTQVQETMAAHFRKNTKGGPFSMNEGSNGSWEYADSTEQAWLDALDDAKGIGYDTTDPAEDKIKGHNKFSNGSGDMGWVTMNPRDETPFTDLRESTYVLNFHARFNESLNARTASQAFPAAQVRVEGVNADNIVNDETWGHKPWEKESLFEDFISTATPRSEEKALDQGGANEFAGASGGDQATTYASLMPDGVRLSGQSLRSRVKESNLNASYSRRGLGRAPRLKILRYPCGARSSVRPFEPIRTQTMVGSANSDENDGVRDTDQIGYLDPGTTLTPGGQDPNLMLQRLIGQTPPFRGTDHHNRNAEITRQRFSNMPYYEGTVDFWIKWDLPPQGSDVANQVVALGEIDPSSHNFSGLFGSTAYGRFYDPYNGEINDPAAPQIGNAGALSRNSNADFEGVQFFVYKEPGGWLRFVRLYFMEAFGLDVQTGQTGTTFGTVVQFGTAMRRIFDQVNPLGGYTGTNDIVNDGGVDNKGFLYARTDAWVDLANAQYDNGTDKRIVLRTHDWHRFTLSYNSNSDKPYRLWIDGRQLSSSVQFYPDNNPALPLGFRNDGAHEPQRDNPLPTTYTGEPEFDVYRTTTKILEINPEDRLTVGCIFRRQIDLTDSSGNIYNTYYDNDPDQGDVDKPPRPVFKFDANFVAVANATIDDFRISKQLLAANEEISQSQFQAYSRYEPAGSGQDVYFEHGFLPIRAEDGELHALPVRLGTIAWTELRPDWDPYARQGLSLATSSGIEMQWAVIDDYAILQQALERGGGKYDFSSANDTGISGLRQGGGVGTEDYWASGGMTLKGAKLPSGQQVGVFLYRAHFRIGDEIVVNNVTPFLLDVTVTVLTPPRKLSFVIEY